MIISIIAPGRCNNPALSTHSNVKDVPCSGCKPTNLVDRDIQFTTTYRMKCVVPNISPFCSSMPSTWPKESAKTVTYLRRVKYPPENRELRQRFFIVLGQRHEPGGGRVGLKESTVRTGRLGSGGGGRVYGREPPIGLRKQHSVEAIIRRLTAPIHSRTLLCARCKC